MPFDQTTRNRLAKFVADARALLTVEITRQLQQECGMDPATGDVTDLARLSHLDDSHRATARILRETLHHYLAGSPKQDARARRETLERIVREQAFTVLNRMCALRMAEARGLLLESIASGYQSRGFQLYARVAGPALGETGAAYRAYLFSLWDEFAVDLPVLFDRFNPQGRLFPRESALLELLALINDAELQSLWGEDETIGWVYQYFNSQEERRQMRAASQAPRNSRELAVRNQFFTPRYVVEFLTDNTLGRIWYEMTRGATLLVDRCRYLVRRPHEIFLAAGEVAPVAKTAEINLSQEELLRRAVYIPFRWLKDPRTILMLDPACGSMHFGLYAFDLYEVIYTEAWDLEESLGYHALLRPEHMRPLHETYPDKATFLRDVPRLIIEHNIHGIDIDPRAVQIAGLSLWLRAQRSWQAQGVKPSDRPTITKSNIVCAEPMPGDAQMLAEFADGLQPKVLGELVKVIFDKMQLAGEAGSLLKIEEEIAQAVETARKAAPLLDLAELPDPEDFWAEAETRLIDALRDYAEQAEGEGLARRLFAADAARGFAFIDVCRKRYDVVLMNPPFGDASRSLLPYLRDKYEGQPNDLFACFVERAVLHQSCGFVGQITPHTFLTYGSFANFRTTIFGKRSEIITLADFGLGVMDDAMVRSASYVIGVGAFIPSSRSVFFRLIGVDDKEDTLVDQCDRAAKADRNQRDIYLVDQTAYSQVGEGALAYWIPTRTIARFRYAERFGEIAGDPRLGVQTSNNEQFLRLAWEVNPGHINANGWRWYLKGGEFLKYFSDIHLTIDWRADGQHIADSYGQSVRLRDLSQYNQPGLNYPLVNEFGLNVGVLPQGTVYDNTSPSIFALDEADLLVTLGLVNSRFVELCFRSLTSTRHWQVGYLRQLPWVRLLQSDAKVLHNLVEEAVSIQRFNLSHLETSVDFATPLTTRIRSGGSLRESVTDAERERLEGQVRLIELDFQLDLLSMRVFSVADEELLAIEMVVGQHPMELPPVAVQTSDPVKQYSRPHRVSLFPIETRAWKELRNPRAILGDVDAFRDLIDPESATSSIVSYCLGITLGRWDIRFANGQISPPRLLNPFASLPSCIRGMLQNAAGLPATPADVTADYPLRISWPGILVNDDTHREDIVGRVREALAVIWPETHDAIEQEACQILGVATLHDYFASPNRFFDDHLKRYSKSRRQAPIYWPLSTPSGSYTLWLYYHRLTDQTLYSCVNDFVEPKLAECSRQMVDLRRLGQRSAAQERELETLGNLVHELEEFRAELLHLAPLWKPNLNDGVQITAAPLWRLFQHRAWQKRLRETWEELVAGEYDWAHLAYTLWPERVRAKCKTDKSLAIAHGLEELYVEPAGGKKKGKGRAKAVEAEQDELFE